MFSIYDGFGYFEDDNFVSFSHSKYLEEAVTPLLGNVYDGQAAAGSGQIEDLSKYIVARYGTGYTLLKQKSLSSWTFTTQNRYNQYNKNVVVKDSNGNDKNVTYGEGNCGIAALYSVLNYWARIKGESDLPRNNVTLNPINDNFYEDLINQTNSLGIQTWVVARTIVPQIYRDLRNWFRDNHSYQTDGTNTFEYGNAVSHVTNLYDVSLKTNHILVWSFNGQVETEIDEDRPTVWAQAPTSWTDDAKSYGNHAMVVKGYKVYIKTSSWWFFQSTSYLKFMEMNDNWNSSNRYIDYDAYASTLGGGTFGSFLKIY